MRLPSPLAPTGLLLLLALLPACAAGRDISLADPQGTTVSNGQIRFVMDGTITLTPGETRAITVAVSPSEPPSDIRFSLIGDALDGSLDRSLATTDDSGDATVVVRAPQQATTFRLRATILDGEGQPGPSVEAGVAVSDQGFGTLRVLP